VERRKQLVEAGLQFGHKGTEARLSENEERLSEEVGPLRKTKPMRLEEFDAERRWWDNRSAGTDAWFVSAEEIRARGYNLDIPNPVRSRVAAEDPAVVLEELDRLTADAEVQVATVRRAISAVLGITD
jgi:hypothetical protein